MRLRIILLLVIPILYSKFAKSQSFNLNFDPLIEEFLSGNQIPGFGLTIVQNDGVLASKGFGIRNPQGEDANEDTIFPIGSVSKGFCALICAQVLSEKWPDHGEGVFDLPIADLAPDYDLMLSDRFRSEQVNFRDLLSHRTCLNPSMLAKSFQNHNSSEIHLYRQRYARQVCPFRSKLVYNDHMVDLACSIIAHIAGKPYKILVAELFAKIGMTSSRFVEVDDDFNSMRNLSRGFYRDQDGVEQLYNIEILRRIHLSPGAGGILSTPRDMVKYLMLHLNLGVVDGVRIFSKELMVWLRKASNLINFSGYETGNGDFAAGLGLFLGIHKGNEMISHGGYLAPYSGFLSLYPKQDIGIYTVSNGPGLAPDHRSLHMELFKIITSDGQYLPEINRPKLQKEVKKFIKNIQSLKESKVFEEESLAGLYGNAVEGDLTIRLDSSQLKFEMGVWGSGILKPTLKGAIYELIWDSDFIQDGLATFGSIPNLEIQWNSQDELQLALNEDSPVKFIRGATIDKFPFKPWDDGSCGPYEPS